MWRDPLDELIEDLEAALPPQSAAGNNDLPPVHELQFYLYELEQCSTDEERQRVETDPRFARVRAYWDGLAAQRQKETPRHN